MIPAPAAVLDAMTAATYVVEVNECRVFATTSGAHWWTLFRLRFDPIGRITDTVVSLGGNLCEVACEDRAEADWLAEHMVRNGLPASAIRVRRLIITTPTEEQP